MSIENTFNDVRKMLEEQEAEDSRSTTPLHKMSATGFIHAALKLEERQSVRPCFMR